MGHISEMGHTSGHISVDFFTLVAVYLVRRWLLFVTLGKGVGYRRTVGTSDWY